MCVCVRVYVSHRLSFLELKQAMHMFEKDSRIIATFIRFVYNVFKNAGKPTSLQQHVETRRRQMALAVSNRHFLRAYFK